MDKRVLLFIILILLSFNLVSAFSFEDFFKNLFGVEELRYSPQTNLVKNSGFESEEDSWIKSITSNKGTANIQDSIFYSGKKSAKLTTLAKINPSRNFSLYKQNIVVEKGKTYCISAFVKGDYGFINTFSDGKYNQTFQKNYPDWTKISLERTISNLGVMIIFLQIRESKTNQTVYFDDVSVVEGKCGEVEIVSEKENGREKSIEGNYNKYPVFETIAPFPSEENSAKLILNSSGIKNPEENNLELSALSGSQKIVIPPLKLQSGLHQFCSKNNNFIVIVSRDDCSNQLYNCPSNYPILAGSFHVGNSNCDGEDKSCDTTGNCIKSGWLNICSKDDSVKLVNYFDNCNERIKNCPLGYLKTGEWKIENLVSNPCDGNPRAFDFFQDSMNDGWVALCSRTNRNIPEGIVVNCSDGNCCPLDYSFIGNFSIDLILPDIYNSVQTNPDICNYTKLEIGTTYPYETSTAKTYNLTDFINKNGYMVKVKVFDYWDANNDGTKECMRRIKDFGAHVGLKVRNPDTGTIYYLNVHGNVNENNNFIFDDFDLFQKDGDILRYVFTADPREGMWKVSNLENRDKSLGYYPEFARNNMLKNYNNYEYTYINRTECSTGIIRGQGNFDWRVFVKGVIPNFSFRDGWGNINTFKDVIEIYYGFGNYGNERNLIVENEGWKLFFAMGWPRVGSDIGGNRKFIELEKVDNLPRYLKYLLSTQCFNYSIDPANLQPIERLEIDGNNNDAMCGTIEINNQMNLNQQYTVFIDISNVGFTDFDSTIANPYSLKSLNNFWEITKIDKVCNDVSGFCYSSPAVVLKPENQIPEAPGWYRFWFNITAPSEPGNYSFKFQMSQNKNNVEELFGDVCEKNIRIVDATPPQVTILRPENIIYRISKIEFNFSLNEAGYCEYSLNNGIVNYTMTANSSKTGFNATRNVADGNYVVRAYCNDTKNNWNITVSKNFGIQQSQPGFFFSNLLYIVNISSNGNINIIFNGENYTLHSLVSTPNYKPLEQGSGGWAYDRRFNSFGSYNNSTDWLISINPINKTTIEITGKTLNDKYNWTRRLIFSNDKIAIKDRISNNNNSFSGFAISNRFIGNFNESEIRLGGKRKNCSSCYLSSKVAENPSVFIPQKRGSVLFITRDDKLRVFLKAYSTSYTFPFSMESNTGLAATYPKLGFKPFETREFEWEIYVQNNTNYFDIVNKLRKEWNLNKQLDGQFAQTSHYVFSLPRYNAISVGCCYPLNFNNLSNLNARNLSRCATKYFQDNEFEDAREMIRYMGIKYIELYTGRNAFQIFEDNATTESCVPAGTCRNFTEEFNFSVNRLKQISPETNAIIYFNPVNYFKSLNAPLNDARFNNDKIINATGNHLWQRIDQDWYFFYPTTNNTWGYI